ncbi:alpha/beta fold hydrolase [Colwelliaceae bacterium 6441]
MYSKGVTLTGKGPAIVFLHSSLSSSKQWRKLALQLSHDFTCINIDLLGYGDAEQVAEASTYSFETEISRINNVLKQLKVNDKYHLVGHSCGGAIALKMAVENPSKLESLSLYEPVAFHLYENSADEKDRDFLQQIKHFAEKIALLDNNLATQAFVDFWNQEGYFKALPKTLQQIMSNDIGKVHLDFKGILHECYSLDDLKNINCPTMVLYGKYSPEISQRLSKKIIENLTHVYQLEVSSGHMAPISHADLVEPEINEFVRNNTINSL